MRDNCVVMTVDPNPKRLLSFQFLLKTFPSELGDYDFYMVLDDRLFDTKVCEEMLDFYSSLNHTLKQIKIMYATEIIDKVLNIIGIEKDNWFVVNMGVLVKLLIVPYYLNFLEYKKILGVDSDIMIVKSLDVFFKEDFYFLRAEFGKFSLQHPFYTQLADHFKRIFSLGNSYAEMDKHFIVGCVFLLSYREDVLDLVKNILNSGELANLYAKYKDKEEYIYRINNKIVIDFKEEIRCLEERFWCVYKCYLANKGENVCEKATLVKNTHESWKLKNLSDVFTIVHFCAGTMQDPKGYYSSEYFHNLFDKYIKYQENFLGE